MILKNKEQKILYACQLLLFSANHLATFNTPNPS